mgnify:CR=1 FL=1
MASIEKRGKRSWRLVIEAGTGVNGKRNRKTKTIKIEDEALLKTTKKLRDYLNDQLYEFKREVEAGEYIKPEKMLFKDFVNKEYKPKFMQQELAESTQVTFNQHLRLRIIPWFGEMKMSSVKTMHVVDFMNYLKTPKAIKKKSKKSILSSGTRSYILKVLRSIFDCAIEWGFIRKNPCVGVRWPKIERHEVEVYDDEELQQIFTLLLKEPLMWQMIILVTFFGGFRREEVTALELDDLNFEDDTIKIDKAIPMKVKGKFIVKDPKSETSKRNITMPHWFMTELKKYCSQWKIEKMKNIDNWKTGDENYLFCRENGFPLSPNSITNWWRIFLKKNNMRHIKLHGLRHTSATYLLENGANIKAIQKRLGHANAKTTADIYLHVTRKEKSKLVDEFDQFKSIK